jgi:hypothetical protein
MLTVLCCLCRCCACGGQEVRPQQLNTAQETCMYILDWLPRPASRSSLKMCCRGLNVLHSCRVGNQHNALYAGSQHFCVTICISGPHALSLS